MYSALEEIQMKRKNNDTRGNDCKKISSTEKEVIRLKSNLIYFDDKLKLLIINFSNFENLIYEECSELKRLVQLNTEEAIALVKQVNNIDIDCNTCENNEIERKISSLNEANEIMINKIDKYEKDTCASIQITSSNRSKLNREINRFKLISKHFIAHWIHMDFNQMDLNKICKAETRLNEYQVRLNNLINEFNQLVFSGNGIMRFRLDDEKLGYLYLNQSINIKRLNRCNLINLFIDSGVFDVSDIQFELFESNYLISFRKRGEKNTFIYIFNGTMNKIEKKVILENCRIHNLKRIDNTIFLVSSNNYFYDREILVIDDTLTIIKRKQVGSLSLVGGNHKYLFCFEDININGRCNSIKIFDWNLDAVDSCINFQQANKNLPFYIPFETLHISIWQLEHIGKKYVARSISDCTLEAFVIIYDEQGTLIRLIKVAKMSDGLFRFDSDKTHVIVHDCGKLMYFDLNLNCMPVKEIELVNISKYYKLENVFNFLTDKKNEFRIHFFHESFIFS